MYTKFKVVYLASSNIMQDRKSGGKVKRWVGGCPWVGDDGGVEWGGRPKNRRWNTWRPDEEDHTPVAPAAWQCHPLVNKLSCLVL